MIQIGKWAGYYCFTDEKVNKIRGFQKTFFEIEILSVSEDAFVGKFQDDLSTGGTEGVGTWRFKFGFIWFGIIPIPVIPSKGNWSMSKK